MSTMEVSIREIGTLLGIEVDTRPSDETIVSSQGLQDIRDAIRRLTEERERDGIRIGELPEEVRNNQVQLKERDSRIDELIKEYERMRKRNEELEALLKSLWKQIEGSFKKA